MTRVKICGITRIVDATKAAQLGAWAVGFIFYKKSPRFVGGYKARKIVAQLPPFITPVGVFVNQKEGAIKDIAEFCGIKTLQFHGDETPDFCNRFKKYKVIRAIRVDKKIDTSELKKYDVDAFLFDTAVDGLYGGSGKTFDWSLVKPARSLSTPIILSGGINPDNIADAIKQIKPYAVDVSSGVESAPGQKNERAMKNLFASIPL